MEFLERNKRMLGNAQRYCEIWKLVKDNVRFVLKHHQRGMMLFLDDLPLRIGVYHPLGTNNIVLNRTLTNVIEDTVKSKKILNSLIYTLLLHEYLHALGYIEEAEVHFLVYKITKHCLGRDHVATRLAELGSWSLLHDLPLGSMKRSRGVMEIVKDFEVTNNKYIV